MWPIYETPIGVPPTVWSSTILANTQTQTLGRMIDEQKLTRYLIRPFFDYSFGCFLAFSYYFAFLHCFFILFYSFISYTKGSYHAQQRSVNSYNFFSICIGGHKSTRYFFFHWYIGFGWEKNIFTYQQTYSLLFTISISLFGSLSTFIQFLK